MRSGSSRLFIVLLHLVGVRTNLPLKRRGLFFNVGIVGVHPVAILLEKLLLDPKDGLDGLLRKMPQSLGENVLNDPYWLQDDKDGRCLGPTGFFAECGDATLWVLHRQKSLNRDNHDNDDKRGWLVSLWPWTSDSDDRNANDEESSYALQLIDTEVIPITSRPGESSSSGLREFVKQQILDKTRRKSDDDLECLMVHNDKQKQLNNDNPLLHLGSCSSKQAWGWSIDGKGVLSHMDVKAQKRKRQTKQHQPSLCVWRKINSNGATVESCSNPHDPQQQRKVDFSLVGYKTNPTAPLSQVHTPEKEEPIPPAEEAPSSNLQPQPQQRVQHTLMTTSNSDSSPQKYTSMHPELKPMSSLLFTPLSQESHAVSVLKDSNPLMMTRDINSRKKMQPSSSSSSSSKTSLTRTTPMKKPPTQKLLHVPPSTTRAPVVTAPRKIPKHPYLEEAKNNMWKDPATDLEYHTDISDYLGFDRKTAGRHSLMGVGQYSRTVFNVKIYGIAFYVSKKDVLADPAFESFSTQSVEELQQNQNFYNHLLTGTKFDKTLFLNLNMQLNVDTMMSTLDADWSMLSQDLKDLIIASCKRPRQADQRMLEKIKSKDNSGNCSCAQLAPPEYNADPKCCARGTELLFISRKNGDFEVRLDRRVMDTFPHRSDLATGIFYEYLNPLDPISLDALQHMADGFPFLLSPLARISGVGIAMDNSHSSHNNNNNNNNGSRLAALTNAANGAASRMQAGTVAHMSEAVKMMNDSAHNVQEFMDRKKAETRYHMVRLLQRMPFVPEELKRRVNPSQMVVSSTDWERVHTNHNRSTLPSIGSEQQWSIPTTTRSDKLFFAVGELSDEIGAIIHPTTDFSRKLFAFTVHFYLMLLFFVSLPESKNTKTVKRKLKKLTGCNSSDDEEEEPDATSIIESEDEEEDHEEDVVDVGHESNSTLKKGSIPKSLSYFL